MNAETIRAEKEAYILSCGMCKHHRVDADMDGVQSVCKRLDHKHFQFFKPDFSVYDCGQHKTLFCKDFEPGAEQVWLREHWESVDDFILPYIRYVGIVVDGDNSVIYRVPFSDFYNGTFVDEHGSLKWVQKVYRKGGKIVCEKRGVADEKE